MVIGNNFVEFRIILKDDGTFLLQFRQGHAVWGNGDEAWVTVPMIKESDVKPWR